MKTQGLNNLPCASFTRPREALSRPCYHKGNEAQRGRIICPKSHSCSCGEAELGGGLDQCMRPPPGVGFGGRGRQGGSRTAQKQSAKPASPPDPSCPALRPPSPSSGSRQENVRKPRPGAPPSRPRRRPAPDLARPPAPRRSRPRTPRPLRSGSALAASHRCPHGSWSLLGGRCGPSRAAGQRSPMPGAQSCVTARGGREDSERHRDAAECKDQLIPAPRSGLTAPCRPTRGLSLWSHSFPGQRKPLRERQLPWKGLSLRSQVPRLMSFFPGGRAGNETAQA